MEKSLLLNNLIKAIRAEDETIILDLISKDVDPNDISSIKGIEVPVWFAALPISRTGGVQFKPKALSILLTKGANIHAVDKHGRTALHALVQYCKDDARFVEAVKVLLENGLGINEGEEPAIYSAVCSENVKKVTFLLEAGADPNIVNKESGETPLIRACINCYQNARELVDTLLKFGADVNIQETRKGRSSLMWAVANKNLEITKILIKAGANLNAENTQENTNAYLLALEYKYTEIVEWIEGFIEHNSGPKNYRALQIKNIQNEKWQEAIDAGLEAASIFPTNWKVTWYLAFSYRKLGSYRKSSDWAQITIDLEFNLNAVNLLLLNYINESRPEEAISIWKNYSATIKVSKADIGLILANLLIAYFMLKKYSEAIIELGDPWLVKTNESVFYLNLACTYTKLGDSPQAIRAVLATVKHEYPIEKLIKDEDLQPLAELTAFTVLRNVNFTESACESVFNGKDCVELIWIQNMVIERKMFSDKKITRSQFDFSLSSDALLKFAELKDQYIRSGWSADAEKALPVEEDLAEEVNLILQEYLAKQKTRKASAGAILLEWDYESSYYLYIEKYEDVEKARSRYLDYGTDENTIFEDSMGHHERIYSQQSFQRMVNCLSQKEGFRKIKKMPLIFFIHAEHDSGNEFVIEHKIEELS